MAPIDLNQFAQVARGDQARVILDGQNVRTQGGGLTGRITRFFTRENTLQTQNQQVRNAFRNALKNQFGSTVADQVFPVGVNANQNLSTRDIRQVVQNAQVEFRNQLMADQNRAQALRPNLDQAINDALAQNGVGNVSDHGRFKLAVLMSRKVQDSPGLFDWSQAPNNNAEGIARRNMACEVLDDYEAKELLALDQRVHDLTHSVNARDQNLVAMVDTALDNIDFPDERRAGMYRDFLKDALLNIVDMADTAGGPHAQQLLQSIGGQLSKRLDQQILFAMGNESRETQQNDINTMLTRFEQDKVGFFQNNIGTFQRIQTEILHSTRNINDIMVRFNNDRQNIGQTFFPAQPPANNAYIPQNLSDLQITNSDPHHGGNRVMIMSFDNQPDKKTVYKPRDCRVDAKLIAEPNIGGVGQTVAGLINGIKPDSIPSYKYLLGGGHQATEGTYAYVEYLSHEDGDYQNSTPAEINNYFRDMGRLQAVANLFGLTDLHHGNVIAHGKRPYLTDLEIAFSSDALQDKGPGGTGFSDALTRSHEADAGYFFFARDGKIDWGEDSGKDTSNFLVDQEGNKALYKNDDDGMRYYFEHGFREIVDMFKEQTNNSDLLNLLDDFRGMHVRYHPIATGDQQQRLNLLDISSTDDRENLANRYTYKPGVKHDTAHTLDELNNLFLNSMNDDIARGDVPYYTRELGNTDEVFHNGTDPMPGTDTFAYDGLRWVSDRIRSLRRPNGPEQLMEKFNQAFRR